MEYGLGYVQFQRDKSDGPYPFREWGLERKGRHRMMTKLEAMKLIAGLQLIMWDLKKGKSIEDAEISKYMLELPELQNKIKDISEKTK